MATLSELLKELRTLPFGNVYQKMINGRPYHYHQYFQNGKRISKLVSEEEVPTLLEGIKRRKEIQRQIKAIKPKDVTLSKSASELTGALMSENRIVAIFDHGKCLGLDGELAPLIVKRTRSIEQFLKLRVMDMSRTNARILMKVLGIQVQDDYKAALYSYALSVSDNYWFRPRHSKLKYQDLPFHSDALFETALEGQISLFFNKAQLSPEITTPGSFEKGWRRIDGEWWLYKRGNPKQIFSELFCSRFASLIGVNSISYELDGPYIRSKNFSPAFNFEPMASLCDDDDRYETVFALLHDLDPLLSRDYLKLIFFDSVVNNIDRHNENMGLLRDANDGRILSLAPNFDNNLALLSVSDTLNPNLKKDGFVQLFVSFLAKNETAKEEFKTLVFPEISTRQILDIIEGIPIAIEEKENLAEAVFTRYESLKHVF